MDAAEPLEVEPLDEDGVFAVSLGLVCWSVALVVLGIHEGRRRRRYRGLDDPVARTAGRDIGDYPISALISPRAS